MCVPVGYEDIPFPRDPSEVLFSSFNISLSTNYGGHH